MAEGQSCVVPSNCAGLWQRAVKNGPVVYVCVCVQIVVEGVVGSGVLGDIAIDDIAIRNGSCPHAG